MKREPDTLSTLDSPPSSAGGLPGGIVCVDPLSIQHWDELIRAFPGATAFHSRGWMQTLHATYSHQPFYLASKTGTILEGLLPLAEAHSWLTGRKGVSLPFTDACSFLGAQERFKPMVEAALELGQRQAWKYLEFRGLKNRPFEGEPSVTFHGHQLDLTSSEEVLFKNFESSMRRSIRKAEASPLSLQAGASDALLEQYFRLHCLTRRRHGVPPQPFQFFRNLQKYVLVPGHGRIILASLKDGTPVAGVVFLEFGEHAFYKFGASDERWSEYRAANLVMWEGIRSTRNRGSRVLDFGRTTLGNAGLRRFKLAFGCREEAVEYFRFNLPRKAVDKVVDRSAGRINVAFRKVPLWASRWIGSILYRHAT